MQRGSACDKGGTPDKDVPTALPARFLLLQHHHKEDSHDTSRQPPLARDGGGGNATDAAIAAFARDLVRARGRLDAATVANARARGIDDGLIVEIVANVAFNVLTNYTNLVADTAIDFPEVDRA